MDTLFLVRLLRSFCVVLILALQCAAGEPEIVQIDVRDVLNARVVTVVKTGALVALRDTIDGARGLATLAAAR